MEQVDEPHIVGKHADAIIIDESRLMAKCLNCANGGSYKCSKCDGEMYFSKMYFKEEPKDEPQTERKCIDCRFLTYKFGKTWCDIKCDNPHDKVCDRWTERSK